MAHQEGDLLMMYGTVDAFLSRCCCAQAFEAKS